MPPILNRRRQTLKLLMMLAVFCIGVLPPRASSAEKLLKSTHPYIANLGAKSPELDIYRLALVHKAPVLIYVHGGAWALGNKSAVHDMPAHFAARGYVFVSVDYRLVPDVGVPDQLKDIDQALGWITRNIADFGGNPRNLHLMGHSAGAHLVTMTAVSPKPVTARLIASGALRSVISNDTRAYDIPRIATRTRDGRLPRLYTRAFGRNPAFWRAMSPIYQLTPSRPYPAFLLLYSGAGNGAIRRDFARDFAAKLRKNGARATLFDGRHYSHREMNTGIGVTSDITRAIDKFMARQFQVRRR